MSPSPQDHLISLYAEMSDIELTELLYAQDTLTETAQDILRNELKKRDLPRKLEVKRPAARPAYEPRTLSSIFFNAVPGENMLSTDHTQSPDDTGLDDELGTYMSAKVDLRYFDTRNNALRVKAALQQSGIESFIDPYRSESRDPFNRTLLQVTEDDYEGASQALSQLTPENLRDFDPEVEGPDLFTSPDCPRCSTRDPLLESVEPVNRWKCDSCGFEWTEAPKSA